MAAQQRCTLLTTACGLLWLSLLLSCDDVDGCAEKIAHKVKSVGKAVGTRFKLIRKKDKIVDAAGDAAGNMPKPGVIAAVGQNVDCSNPFFPCNPNAMAKIGDAVGDASQVGSVAAMESQKLSRKAKIAAMFSRKVAEDGTKQFSKAQKKGMAAVAAVGVGGVATAVVLSRNDKDKDGKGKGKGKDGKPEDKGPAQGTTVNAPAGPKVQRRTVSERSDDDDD